jgi:hypothetical protein
MRGVVAGFLLIAAQGFAPALAVAAPNDFRVVSGTLVHPATLGPGMTVMVLKSDEGTVYYADLRAVSGIPALRQGAVVTVVGFEGARPDQLVIQVMYPADVAPADTPTVRSQRINGRIGSLDGPTVVVRADNGSEATMLLRGINARILRLLRPGDWVTVFGRPGDSEFVVTGIIQSQD